MTAGESNFAVDCPDCEHGELEIADAVYADCNNCDAAVLRTELGI